MVTLVILDGFGIKKEKYGNAVKLARTPHLDKLTRKYPHTTLLASGEAVGLPAGQVGNSEIGHFTIGVGRVVYQDLLKINKSIEDGSFYTNKALLKALNHAEKNGSNLHIFGILSEGGVHGHIDHLFAILKATKNRKIKNVYIHAFTDGRDTPVTEGVNYIDKTEKFIKDNQINAKIASVCGRLYAMDRESRYDRVQKFYNTIVFGENLTKLDAKTAIKKSYEKGVTDEFVEPFLLDKNATIKEHDSIIFYNFRGDRAREITEAFTDENFSAFKIKKFEDVLYTPMAEYSDSQKRLNVMFPTTVIKDCLSSILTKNRLKHLHISETTKFVHVTFYFNGVVDKPFRNEERICIESINASNFSEYPKMRALEITDHVLTALASKKFDFIVVNYSNPDMVGHTGNLEAAKEAVACVEEEAYKVAMATLKLGGECLITADHGNAEIMLYKNGEKCTTHTTSPVPFILVSDRYKNVKLNSGTLANIAPTILKLFGITPPQTMDKPLF